MARMRIVKNIEKIDYAETKDFFQNRAHKYNEKTPYTVTMYQDSHPELTIERNKYEITKLKKYLEINKNSRILDLACGIGRWAEQIGDEYDYYSGIDFADELINIARLRNISGKKQFYTGSLTQINEICQKQMFNRVLLIGALMYLNDDDVSIALDQAERQCEKKSILCIREPIALNDRLTLKDFFSNELNANYNAIYRSKMELMSLFQKPLIDRGFRVTNEGFLFEDDQNLNNRKETAQYFFILKR